MQHPVSRILSLALAAGVAVGSSGGAASDDHSLELQQAIVAELRGGMLDSGRVEGAPFSAEVRTP